jgi:uncharacterized membrane protein YqgA involved in biofilm formation
VILIGISGALGVKYMLVTILSVALGALVGELLDLDGLLNRFGAFVERKLGGKQKGSFAEGFVSATLLFCVGSMIIIGGINAGVSGDNTVYFTKSVLDFVAAIALSVSLGAGVLLSAAAVFVLQGLLVLCAGLIQPLLSGHMVSEINCVGNLLIVIIGLNLMGITKEKVANYLPAVPLALLLAVFM